MIIAPLLVLSMLTLIMSIALLGWKATLLVYAIFFCLSLLMLPPKEKRAMSQKPMIADAPQLRVSSTGVICPHCGHTHTPDDAMFYDQSLATFECDACAREFDVEVLVETTWMTKPKPQEQT